MPPTHKETHIRKHRVHTFLIHLLTYDTAPENPTSIHLVRCTHKNPTQNRSAGERRAAQVYRGEIHKVMISCGHIIRVAYRGRKILCNFRRTNMGERAEYDVPPNANYLHQNERKGMRKTTALFYRTRSVALRETGWSTITSRTRHGREGRYRPRRRRMHRLFFA